MNPITIPNITIPVIGLPTIGIPSVGFPSASGGGLAWPAGLKESIKAIYDPAKQGMTNYDVIEAYAEDFTYWTLDNTGITSTPKKIVIPAGTELKYVIAFRGFNSFTAGFDIKYTGNAVITYRYNKEDGTVGTIAIDKSGIYHLPASVRAQKNFGFYCNPQTVTEEATIEQLPTSILKDLSGNGNHAYLYGGKGKLNSGMGVYKLDNYTTTKWYYPFENGITKIKANSFVTNIDFTEQYGMYDVPDNYTFSVSNLDGFKVRSDDGEVEIVGNICTLHLRESATNGGRLIFTCKAGTVITEIPDYPNQLCYDGKMYAVCYGFPILTDYTVMAERTWFEKEEYSAFISNSLGGMEDPSNGAFSVELKSLNSFTTISFGSMTSIGIPEKGITYQTKQSYNGNSINVGTKESNDILILGSRYFYKNNNTPGSTWTGCHGAIIIADRSFTEEEINWLKQNWDKI